MSFLYFLRSLGLRSGVDSRWQDRQTVIPGTVIALVASAHPAQGCVVASVEACTVGRDTTGLLYLLCWHLLLPLKVCIPKALPNLPSSPLTLPPAPPEQSLQADACSLPDAFPSCPSGTIPQNIQKERGHLHLFHVGKWSPIYSMLSPGTWLLTLSCPLLRLHPHFSPNRLFCPAPFQAALRCPCSTSLRR